MPDPIKTSGPLNLQGTFTVQAQAPVQDGQKPPNPKFALSAYNGGPMTVAGWKYPVVVDGQGVRCANPNGSVPVYATHEETVANLLGQTGSTTVVQGKIACEGEITGMGADASDACKQVMLHAKNGFQWQCSIGAAVDTAEFIADAKSAVVNGAEVKGPVYVARSTVLGHVAIVPLGADTTTSAKIAASAAGEITMSTELEKWINAEFGLDAQALSEPQRKSFQAKYDQAFARKTVEAQQPSDPVEKMRQDTGAELRRIEAVRKLAVNQPEILAKAVEEGWTVDATELAVLRAGHKPNGTTTAIQAGGVPLTQRVIEAAGIIGGGLKPDVLVKDKQYGEQVVEAAMRLSRHGLGPKAVMDPGYIRGYVPGVRENGGQYTHAAIWSVMAMARLGNAWEAWRLFSMLNPIRHADSPEKASKYKVEPYVLAADVYSAKGHEGRGGWTWYTGSAGWMYRLLVEDLLGLRLEVDRLTFSPLLPEEWSEYTLHYRYRNTFYHIRVVKMSPKAAQVHRVVLDGIEQPDKSIHLVDDGQEHPAVVEVGESSSTVQPPSDRAGA